MRLERIIAAVTRTLATATAREIFAVVSFTDAMRFHLWRHQMLDGMPMYLGSIADSHASALNLGNLDPNRLGSKRVRYQFGDCLMQASRPVLASCTAGITTA